MFTHSLKPTLTYIQVTHDPHVPPLQYMQGGLTTLPSRHTLHCNNSLALVLNLAPSSRRRESALYAIRSLIELRGSGESMKHVGPRGMIMDI